MEIADDEPGSAVRRAVPSGVPTLLIGLVLVAVGVSLSIRAEIGVAPYDVLTTGLVSITGIEIGLAAMVVPVVFVVVAALLGGRPGPGTVLAVLLVGPILGLVLRALPELEAMAPRLGFFVLGFAVIATGITAVVVAEVGPGPAELLMLVIHDRGVPIAPARTGIEIGSVLLGWALGGQVGVGTVLFALLIGPVLARMLRLAGFDPQRADELSDCASPGA